MRYRIANESDIPGMTVVRLAVQENRLSDPAWLTQTMWLDALEQSGKACTWVCESEGRIVGFSSGRIDEQDIWALFVSPDFEGQGIGTRLLDLATEWLVGKGVHTVELSTSNQTRADGFYQYKGWQRGELNAKGEVVFRLHSEPQANPLETDLRKS